MVSFETALVVTIKNWFSSFLYGGGPSMSLATLSIGPQLEMTAVSLDILSMHSLEHMIALAEL